MTLTQIFAYIFGPTGLIAGLIAIAAIISHRRGPAHRPPPPSSLPPPVTPRPPGY